MEPHFLAKPEVWGGGIKKAGIFLNSKKNKAITKKAILCTLVYNKRTIERK